MTSVGGVSGRDNTAARLDSTTVDFSVARAAYLEAVSRPLERHAEVGVLSSSGTVTAARLGIDESYGAHRVGSVTKTFTTFLAMKLINDGILPKGLATKCGDVIEPAVLARVFEDEKAAAEMTLEQLLSHTSGLEYDDHCRPQEASHAPTTLQERFLQEPTVAGGRKYQHVCRPGDGIGLYSNAGVAVAGWMIEAAYNHHYGQEVPFSLIMQQEIFEKVFGLSESCIRTGPTGDVIQSAAGDMTSSVADLMKVASCLQQGEAHLEHQFGVGWQHTMLAPRDIFHHHGLGCGAGASVIQHAGMNRELFGVEERDVTALVQFPLRPGQPGLVAMCDSSALGPGPAEQRFMRALEEAAGTATAEEAPHQDVYDLTFNCPRGPVYLFHGDAYLATNIDPFTSPPPENIICSRNGMEHKLVRDPGSDGEEHKGYRDENGTPWLFITKEEGHRIIYSPLCLLTAGGETVDLTAQQPTLPSIRALQGVYRNAEHPEEHPTYTFVEKEGHLYMQEDGDASTPLSPSRCFPCLYIPDDSGGAWVVSDPQGRKLRIRFPVNPDADFLMITDIATGVQQLPHHSKRVYA